MKKKLLSLVLAGAMVASTSVSAFATTSEKVDIQPGDGRDVNVSITGNLEDSGGDIVPGTVSVTVPTAAVFNVKHSDGSIVSAGMEIVNHSEEEVKVLASSFTDANGPGSINLVNQDGLTASNKRNDVFLKLTGGEKDIFFTSELNDGKYGKIYDVATGSALSSDTEIATVNKQSTVKLKLEGTGSIKGSELSDPIADNFKLVLKIKRAR